MSASVERRLSKRLQTRRGSAPYVKPDKSGDNSTGLTKYMGDSSLNWDGDATRRRGSLVHHHTMGDSSLDRDGDATRSESFVKRGLKSFGRGKAKAPPQPEEIDIWKPTPDARFGITFEMPHDESIKGIIVADIRSEGLAARSKKLKLGDVLHVVNGQAVSTPQAAAMLLREAKGVVQLVVTRAGATSRLQSGGDDGLSKGLKPVGEEEPPADEPNTTVVVSCSALIHECKHIVGDAGELTDKLDALFAKLKSKEIKSAAALKELGQLVGQTTVEQAGLVIANAQQGTLAEGWVEYYDKDNGRPYYYNVHTKATTWYTPRKDKPPPPPPPRRPSGQESARSHRASKSSPQMRRTSRRSSSVAMEVINNTSQGHAVSEVIAAMQTKRKMVEAVQSECQRGHDQRGLETVSL